MVGRAGSDVRFARKILTVSNRGPMEFHLDELGGIKAVPASGGLATALRAPAGFAPMTWLSNAMTEADRSIATGEIDPGAAQLNSRFITLDPKKYELFYGVFANEVLWFLQHSQPWPEDLTSARMQEAWDGGYVAVNQEFADAVVKELAGGDYKAVMFHDYHFYLAPGMVRQARPGVYLQQFVHIPWPAPEVWARLDKTMLTKLCEGLLGNDSLVFQTPEAARAFLLTCRDFVPEAAVDVRSGKVLMNDRTTRVWDNGISVDPEELATEAASPEFSRYRYMLRPAPGQRTIVRVDRLDPTKNVIRGFEAYEMLLQTHPELHGKVNFLSLLVPSKSEIASYRRYQDDAQEYAEAINQRYGDPRWKPIKVYYENNRTQALAAMSLYDVLLVNPLADGMNLVAKEGPMVNTRDGVLVLSERAGAFAELAAGAIAVDPENVAQTAAALHQALTMLPAERNERASRIRQVIRKRDLRAWFTQLILDIEDNAPISATTAA